MLLMDEEKQLFQAFSILAFFLITIVSKSDCYVALKLPTASPLIKRTPVVYNSSDPEWNETFQYRIHSAVKVSLFFFIPIIYISPEEQSFVTQGLLSYIIRQKCGKNVFFQTLQTPLQNCDEQGNQLRFSLLRNILNENTENIALKNWIIFRLELIHKHLRFND